MVHILVFGFDDFGYSSDYHDWFWGFRFGFRFLFRFSVLKNWTNLKFWIFFVKKKFFWWKKNFLMKKKYFDEKKIFSCKKVKNWPIRWKKRPKTIIKTVIFLVRVRVLSGYRFSIFFGLFSSNWPKSSQIPVFIRLQFCSGSGSLFSEAGHILS